MNRAPTGETSPDPRERCAPVMPHFGLPGRQKRFSGPSGTNPRRQSCCINTAWADIGLRFSLLGRRLTQLQQKATLRRNRSDLGGSPLKLLSALTTALALAAALPAGAQTFPDKAITIIVGASPGGSTDVSARLLAEPLSKALGKPVVVENKPGASLSITHILTRG